MKKIPSLSGSLSRYLAGSENLAGSSDLTGPVRWRNGLGRMGLRGTAAVLLCGMGAWMWPAVHDRPEVVLGILWIFVFFGLALMMYRPGYRGLSLLALTDVALFLRVVTDMDREGMLVTGTMARLLERSLGRLLSESADLPLMLLLAGGVFSGLYVVCLCRGYVRRGRLLSMACAGLYLAVMIVLGVRPGWIDGWVLWLVFIVFALSRFCLFWAAFRCCCGDKNGRAMRVLVQAVLMALVTGGDIICLQGVSLPSIWLLYSYTLLLAVHTMMRLFDVGEIYSEKVRPGSNLESLLAERTRHLLELNERLASLSEKDALTGTYNRMRFDALLEEMIEQRKGDKQRRALEPLFLCILDLDFFKKINDRFGHDQGDRTLKELTETVGSMLPEHAALARLGGEEFAILIPAQSETEVYVLIEGIRKRLDTLSYSPRRTTASFGLAVLQPHMSARDFLKEADRCLYKAKAQGRNTVVASFGL